MGETGVAAWLVGASREGGTVDAGRETTGIRTEMLSAGH